MSQQLSKYRHISITAHYTGYIWYQLGWSHPAFATQKGKLITRLAQPFEYFTEREFGWSVRESLKQRHEVIDLKLKELIETHPDLQILEIACGLSPRGWFFRNKFPNLNYRELDLPEMANIKTQALKAIQQNSPDVLTANIFNSEFKNILNLFDAAKPLVIISEGLINYFDQSELKLLLSNIQNHASNFSTLYYLSDIYPEPTHSRYSKLLWASSKILKTLSRSKFSFHFKSPLEIQNFFMETGFKETEVLQPSLHLPANKTKNSKQHADLVWIIFSKTSAL